MLMMFRMKNKQSQKDLPWTWSVLGALSCCLWMFWVSKRNGRGNAKLFNSKGRTKFLVFCLGFMDFCEWFHRFIFSFDSSLFPKASPLNVWWIKVFIGEFVMILGGNTNGIFKSSWHPAPLLFHPCFRMLVWCNYGMRA